jgi:hypothetical protein
VYLTPVLRIGGIGLDTNVFYTPTDRQADLTARGGPGLEIVLPIHRVRFTTAGNLDYLYFLRTESQRRWNGNGFGRFDWKGGRTEATLQESYGRSFSRPNFEVDRRIIQIQESTLAEFRTKLFGRTAFNVAAERSETKVPLGEEFLGTDLHRTLSSRGLNGRGEVEYFLTVKTSAILEGARQWYRFPDAPQRDGGFYRARAGLRSTSTVLLSGSIIGGFEWFRRKGSTRPDQRFVSADADLTWHISPRTRLGGSYSRGPRYSAFDTVDRDPIVRMESYRAHADKELLGRRVDLRIQWMLFKFTTETPVALTLPSGVQEVAVRDDAFRTATAELAYRFRWHLRIGLTAGWAARRSHFSDLGIEGLLLGATVNFNP